MKHNKNYFLFYYNANETINGNISTYKDMSLRYILGHLYDKYSAFSIKLEGFNCRNALTTVISNDFVLVHLEGLPFFNGYDTCQLYNNSRVLEMIDFATSGLQGYNFISNCNGVNFWKPSTEKVDFTIFKTRLTNETIAPPDDYSFIFSITGLEAYRVVHPTKDIIIPRFPAKKTYNFTLSTYKAQSIDTRNRAFRFSGINLRGVIGDDYDKYRKFALITKSYAMSEWNGTAYASNFFSNILISGFDWFRPSTAQYYNLGTITQQQEISNIHPTPACVVCQVVYAGLVPPRAFKECYTENVFDKSQDIIDISISNSSLYFYGLAPANTANTQLFPHYTFNFDIVPIEEY